MKVLINHIGYDLGGPKRAVLADRAPGGGVVAAARKLASIKGAAPTDGGGAVAGDGAAGVGPTPNGAAPSSTRSAQEPVPEPAPLEYVLREARLGGEVVAGRCVFEGSVDRWHTGRFWTIDFTDLNTPGRYWLEVREADSGRVKTTSETFEVRDRLLFEESFSGLLYWFKGQRSSGAEDMADRAASFYGARPGTRDLRGGWFDASGDTGKYLTHLSYANHLNPQQTPGVVWTMLAARDLLATPAPGAPALWERRLMDEIAWGADFLTRMQDPEGYFYITLFDQWSKDLDRRIISTFRTQEGHRGEDYQAGYRQGGGMAIAALARAGLLGLEAAGRLPAGSQRPGSSASGAPGRPGAGAEGPGAGDGSSSAPGDRPGAPGRGAKPPETVLPGEYTPEVYLAAAERGFLHLEEHNKSYLDDGKENIIDDYCALLAATELCIASVALDWEGARQERFLSAARRRADSLIGRLQADEAGLAYWRAGEEGTSRPYYHAAEAGLPILALLRYAEAEAAQGQTASRQAGRAPEAAGRQAGSERALVARRAAARALEGELAVTREVTNPFGYARQQVAEPGGPRRTAFFIPHENETGYWWQGENARLASLAAAAVAVAQLSSATSGSGAPVPTPEVAAGGSGDTAPTAGAASVGGASTELRPRALRYAYDQVNWILGLNPFDMCMLQGRGRNNPEYEAAFPNAPGGICNGVTAGVEDEHDIAFLPDPWGDDPLHRWRWSEQWIPHVGWFLFAVSALRSLQ